MPAHSAPALRPPQQQLPAPCTASASTSQLAPHPFQPYPPPAPFPPALALPTPLHCCLGPPAPAVHIQPNHPCPAVRHTPYAVPRTLMANSTLSVPTTLLVCVNTAFWRSIMEYGAERCSPKCTTWSGLKVVKAWGAERGQSVCVWVKCACVLACDNYHCAPRGRA